MLSSLAIGIFGMALLLALWFVVQNQWRKIFADYISDQDVLADRRSCGNCGCTTICKETRNNKMFK